MADGMHGTFNRSAALRSHLWTEGVGNMTAHFPAVTSAQAMARRRLARRAQQDTLLLAFCWLTAAAGLTASYWLEHLALQAASCVLGLIGALAALVLTVASNR